MGGIPGAWLTRLRPRDTTMYVSQGRAVLATAASGEVTGHPEHGFFVYQTRLLCRYRYLIDGQPWQIAGVSNVHQHSSLGYYIAWPPGLTPEKGKDPVASRKALELKISRSVGGGMHEDVDVTNYSQAHTSFNLSLEVAGDFADQNETAKRYKHRGRTRTRWFQNPDGIWLLELDHRAEHRPDRRPVPPQGPRGSAIGALGDWLAGLSNRNGHGDGLVGVLLKIHRAIQIRVAAANSVPTYRRGRIEFRVELGPLETWHACLDLVPFIDGEWHLPAYSCYAFGPTHVEEEIRRRVFIREATGFETPRSDTLSPVVGRVIEQAKYDLASLRLFDLDKGERAWTMAAGSPVYLALFGRDTLTTAWQAALLSTSMLRGTLPVIADFQGREVDDWRDEEPGKLLHEAQTGPLSALDYLPRGRYYGAHTTSAFYPVAVAEFWHWSGDAAAVRPLIRPALDALAWMDRYGDLDGDGFYEYRTRSPQGNENQGWKDSDDGIVYPDGKRVLAPIATCEEQGFVYAAKFMFSEVLWSLGERDEANRLFHEAQELKKRFNEAFWLEDEGFFAMGLDSDKQPIRSAGSNPGHCLATGIVDRDLVLRTAGRLVAGDLFSGWGIRTLSNRHPAYNPHSYHRGSVWPVENGTFALAFMRYGLHGHVELITRAMFEAASLFDFDRLPELFSGHTRDASHPFPAMYPEANWPQAWSASAVICMVQALLGLYPYAPLHLLLVDPHLPEWLPEITLRGLQVGDGRVTLRFRRRPDGHTEVETLEREGRLRLVHQPSPWSLTQNAVSTRLMDVLGRFVPAVG